MKKERHPIVVKIIVFISPGFQKVSGKEAGKRCDKNTRW